MGWGMKIQFTENFKDIFEEKNLTQKQIAEGTGISQGQISRFLNGVIPTAKNVCKICDFLGCSVDYITGLNEEYSYKNSKKGFYNFYFYEEYEKLLKLNNTSHYKLAKQHIVCETSLRFWKNGTLPNFEVMFNIAQTLGGSLDKMLGKL